MKTSRVHSNSLSVVAVLFCAMTGFGGVERTLWPESADTVLKAQKDSSLEIRDGVAFVKTGITNRWPGVRLDFKAGEVDLSEFGRLTVSLSNTTDKVRLVCLSVKSRALQGKSPRGQVRLGPHKCGDIDIPLKTMPWQLDAPLELVGMNGYPTSEGGSMFDLKRVVSLHIFRGGMAEPAEFAVTGIRLHGEGVTPKTLSAKNFLPFVDEYGQFIHDDWPGKIHSDAELEASRIAEEDWLRKNADGPRGDLNQFGGWKDGPQLKATGFFRTEKVCGKWWLVDPDGRLFFSHGIDCVRFTDATGTGFRENYFVKIPAVDDPAFKRFHGRTERKAAHGFYSISNHYPYATYSFTGANRLRKYGEDWVRVSCELAHRRFRAWGINTIGNWSSGAVWGLRKTPYTCTISTAGTPRLANSDGWWGALPDPFNPEFERTLRTRARELAKSVRNDPWCVGVFVDNELSWSDEPRMREVAEKYFATVAAVLKDELPNHLYLGCRIAWGGDVVYTAAAKYCDVVSVNTYARGFIRDLPSGAADKPMMNGEFHFGALDRGMFHTGLVATDSQQDRATAYRVFLKSCLEHPRCVGTHWFQYQDQPLTGRGDGENYQIGFVTVTDTPYPEMVEAARDIARGMYERRY